MHATDVVAYTFNADEYDADCIVDAVLSHHRARLGAATLPTRHADAEQQLDTIAAWLDINRQDERSYDSGEFPKVIFASDDLYHERDGDREADEEGAPVAKPRRCGQCHNALDPGYEEPCPAWQVTMTIDVDRGTAATAREAALAAWEGVLHDGAPVVTVRRGGAQPSATETIDLSDPDA
jgi:hypothetical protein